MKKLFVSQPMRNKSPSEIYEQRQKAAERVAEYLEEPVELLDSFFQETQENPLWCLGKSIEILSEADVAYFAAGWRSARGCLIEHECAIQYGIITIET